jgi:hypothetical protein
MQLIKSGGTLFVGARRWRKIKNRQISENKGLKVRGTSWKLLILKGLEFKYQKTKELRRNCASTCVMLAIEVCARGYLRGLKPEAFGRL